MKKLHLAVLILGIFSTTVAANTVMVARYDFGDGDLTNDSSGNGYTLAGPLGGAANITVNTDGLSAHFDGSGGRYYASYFQADLKANGTRYDAFTVSWWWKTTAVNQDTYASMMASIDNQSLNDWQVGDIANDIQLVGDNGNISKEQASLFVNRWYHSVVVSTGTNVSFYLTEQGADTINLVGTADGIFNLQDLRIGANRAGDLTYDSDIALVTVYDGAVDGTTLDALLAEGDSFSNHTIETPGLTLVYDGGFPVSLKNVQEDELLSSTSDGFYLLETDNTKRYFTDIIQIDEMEYSFSIPGSPERFTAKFNGANDYMTIYFTSFSGFSLAGEQLKFGLNTNGEAVQALALDYMVSVRDTRNFVELTRLSLWETLATNALGAFALYEYVDDDQEDQALLDLWVDEGLPHPKVAGVWDRVTAEAWLEDWIEMAYDTSYLNIVPETLAEHYDFLPYAEKMDAKAIYLWNLIWRGEYWLRYRQNDEINPNMYPNGLTDLLAIKGALSAQNTSMMFHYLCGNIGEEDPEFAAATVSPDLQSWGTVTLNSALSSLETTFIVTPDADVEMPIISTSSSPMEAPPVIPSFFEFKTFRIGSEWISASSVTDLGNGSWQLSGVSRGKWNTRPKSYSAGTSLRGYLRPYNQDFVPNPNSTLLETISARYAVLSNTLALSRSEFDGFEIHKAAGKWGSEKFATLVYKNLDHPTVSNTSGGVPPEAWLEYRFNRVKDTLGSDFQTRQHVGLFSGDESRITPGLEDIEFTMYKFMTLNNRGFSLGSYDVKGVTLSTLASYGLSDELLEKLKNWKSASFAMPSTQREAMDTFRSCDLLRLSINGNHSWAQALWRLSGAIFRKWYALGTDVYTHEWHSGQEHGTITPRFYLQNGDIQALELPTELASGVDQTRIVGRVLAKLDTASTSNIDLMTYLGGVSITVTGSNSTDSDIWNDTVLTSYSVSPSLNLENNRGLGLWVTGDGGGETLVIRLHGGGTARDYVVPVNFTGRQWIEIPTGEQAWRVRDWGWTLATRKYMDYKNIESISIGFGHIPAYTSCNIQVEDLTAMLEIKEPLIAPTITLGEQSLYITGTIDTENHFILDPDGTFTVYDELWNVVSTEQLGSGLLPADFSLFSIHSGSSSLGIWLEVGVQASNESMANPDPNCLKTDFDGNGNVDLADLQLMASDWLFKTPESSDSHSPFDVQPDGSVDLIDFSILASEWLVE